MQTYKYLLILGIIVLVGFAIYREYIGHPDRTLFVLPLFLVAFFMRQRGLARYKEMTDNDRKPEQ